MPTDFSTGGKSDRSSSSDPQPSQLVRPGTSTLSFQQSPLGSLASEILAEMHAAWDAGLPIAAEQWIAQHPRLADEPETAVLVIYEEYCLREEAGEAVDPAQFFARFPQWEAPLRVVLDCHLLFQDESAVFPEAGSELGELRLLSELGRGGAGRVFLATQPSLSDRLLAVKLAPRTGDEHLSLARLQHTHIVPLYLVLEFPQRNLRALCMPFLGGASWSAVLKGLAKRPPAQRSGGQIVQQIDKAEHDPNQTVSVRGPAIGFLARASYIQAISWIGSCLADALHYAHQRGLAHLDIKPSNVLLAGDGQPMLLDFHLAHEIGQSGQRSVDRIGGTKGYMSPEQEQCAAALRAGSPLPVALDARSDVYSLGVLLYESLCGILPKRDEQQSRQLLRQANPQISRGLEDIVHKCLAVDRADRYADAGQLADDLRRYLADVPLRGVANRSPLERWQRWRRRKPHALAVLAGGALALAVTGSVLGMYYRDRLRMAAAAAAEAQQDIDRQDYESASQRSAAGLESLRIIPGQADLKRQLQTQRALAQRGRMGQRLHDVVEQLRFVDNVADLPAAKLGDLEAGCAAIWKSRRQIAGPDIGSTESTSVRTDLLDLALLWTGLIARASPGEEGRAQALEVLDQAQDLCGPSPVLARARGQLARESGSAERQLQGTSAEPRTAWEHNAVGRSLMQQNRLDEAQQQLEAAVRLEPDAFWPNFNLMLCDYRRGQFDKALQMAFVSIALAPKSAECFFNRALCYEALDRPEESLADLNRAGELDSTLAAVPLHRGMLLTKLNRPDEALTELAHARQLGAPAVRVACETALAQVARRDLPAARAALAEALRLDPDDAAALSLKARLDSERPTTERRKR